MKCAAGRNKGSVVQTPSTGGETMIKTITILAAAALFSAAVVAAEPAAQATGKPRTPQQEKMAQCGKDSKGKKGEERKAFMKACLSKKADAAKN
jgi:psiF repeat